MAERKEAQASRGRTDEPAARREGTSRVRPAVEQAATAIQSGAAEAREFLRPEAPKLGTAALVGAGLAIIQPGLIPGMLIGVGAMMIPKLVPSVGPILRPVTKSIVRAGYGVVAGVREVVADVSEQFEDVVAEVRAERSESQTRQEARRQPKPA